jgi:hypothetical protein
MHQSTSRPDEVVHHEARLQALIRRQRRESVAGQCT